MRLILLLYRFAREHPALTEDVRKFCRYLERKHCQRIITPDGLRILHAIHNGYVTARELADRTLIPYVTVTKILRALQAIGAVTITRKPTEPGRGGDRCTRYHWATDNASALLRRRTNGISAKRRAEQLRLAKEIKALLAQLEWPQSDIAPQPAEPLQARAKGTS